MSFFNGPLNKSIFTQELELLTKCLLHVPNKVTFDYKQEGGKKQLYAHVGEKIDLNLSTLLEKTDWTHLNLSESDSQAYIERSYGEDVAGRSDQEKSTIGVFEDLTSAEKMTLVDYTGSGYSAVNAFMHARGVNYSYQTPADTLLKTVFISSGLNKIIPDTSTGLENSYRGEHSTNVNQIQERVASVRQEDSYIETPAYMSTSISESVAKGFMSSMGTDKVFIKFEGLYGKSIDAISACQGEKEYLLPPIKIQWTDHHEVQTLDYQGKNKTIHEFTAKVVNPLIAEENNPDFKDLTEFKALYDWADHHHIDTSVVTEHNKIMLMADCVHYTEDNRLNLLDLNSDLNPNSSSNINLTADNTISYSAIYIPRQAEIDNPVELSAVIF